MTKEEAVATLRGYNEWRRYDGPLGEGPTQPEPKTIGEAIDTVCDALERQENLPSNMDEAAEEWCKANHKGIALSADKKSHYLAEGVNAFKAGADWQKEQFEKNRLAHCDKLTKEEYDRETDFALEIVENERRQPTFTDAINYGMRVMKDQMMKEAAEGVVEDWNPESHPEITIPLNPEEFTAGDKVKLIVVKED